MKYPTLELIPSHVIDMPDRASLTSASVDINLMYGSDRDDVLTNSTYVCNKIKTKTGNTTLSEQFQNIIQKSWKETQWIPLTQIYMSTHFPALLKIITP